MHEEEEGECKEEEESSFNIEESVLNVNKRGNIKIMSKEIVVRGKAQ